MTVTDLDDYLAAFRAVFDAYAKTPHSVSTPPRCETVPIDAVHTPSRGETALFDERMNSLANDPSRPRNPLFANFDPTLIRHTSSWFIQPVSPHLDTHDDPSLRPHTIGDPSLRPHSIDTSSTNNPAALLMGGRITSPRATDKERQAPKLHISRHDIAGLATPVYHGGRHGVPELSLSFMHACGYRSFSPEIEDDVLPCYGSIQLLHKKVKMSWTNPRTLQSGPLVERILEKGITILPKLRGTTACQTFYKSLQQVATSYLLPIMPFDTICVDNNYEGLFPPGLGTDAYCECCIAMLEVLPWLIPIGDYEISAKLSSV
jgi:hypothetical protein